MRNLESLTQQEILALAIALEEDDERAYADYAARLRPVFPASAAVFEAMRDEETSHRTRLIQLYHARFGEHIPLIRREDIRGFVRRRPAWLLQPFGVDVVRRQASAMEIESR